MLSLTVQEIYKRLQVADEVEFESLRCSLKGDDRKGVINALAQAERRLEGKRIESLRLESLYEFDLRLLEERNGTFVLGLDEVGRGCLAGPLAVGAVVLAKKPYIEGLNDSKQIKPHIRRRIYNEIKASALAYCVEYVSANEIDSIGIIGALKLAFKNAIGKIEGTGIHIDLVMLDGNPLHLDNREFNVVKGDSKSACIAAASILAKVERDALMTQFAAQYPQYDFSSNKGYGTKSHMELIKRHGLCDIHRSSFCGALSQPSLF